MPSQRSRWSDDSRTNFRKPAIRCVPTTKSGIGQYPSDVAGQYGYRQHPLLTDRRTRSRRERSVFEIDRVEVSRAVPIRAKQEPTPVVVERRFGEVQMSIRGIRVVCQPSNGCVGGRIGVRFGFGRPVFGRERERESNPFVSPRAKTPLGDARRLRSGLRSRPRDAARPETPSPSHTPSSSGRRRSATRRTDPR